LALRGNPAILAECARRAGGGAMVVEAVAGEMMSAKASWMSASWSYGRRAVW